MYIYTTVIKLLKCIPKVTVWIFIRIMYKYNVGCFLKFEKN